MHTRPWFGTASRAAITIALLALLVVAFTAIVVASQPTLEPAPPNGVARNGLIAFPANGDIWVIEPSGADPRMLVGTPGLDGPVIWSPDGTHLAFWSFAFEGDVDDQSAVEAAMADPDGSVWVARADGTDARTLLEHVKWASRCGHDLSWAHDSQRLAVSYWLTGDGPQVPVIDVLSIDGGSPRRLVEHGVDPYWAPDDRMIAYHRIQQVVVDGDEFAGVWLIGADGTDDRRLSQTSGSGCAFDGPAWSPNGAQIAFYGQGDGYHDIWVANVDGSGELRIGADPADEYWPRWSPDGSRIAFDRVVDPANNAPQFAVSEPDGRQQVMLDHPAVGSRPWWSPDGRMLVGTLLDETHKESAGLLLVDPTGLEEPIEVYRAKVGEPSWQRLAP